MLEEKGELDKIVLSEVKYSDDAQRIQYYCTDIYTQWNGKCELYYIMNGRSDTFQLTFSKNYSDSDWAANTNKLYCERYLPLHERTTRFHKAISKEGKWMSLQKEWRRYDTRENNNITMHNIFKTRLKVIELRANNILRNESMLKRHMHSHQHKLQRIHMCQVNWKGKGKATIDCGCARGRIGNAENNNIRHKDSIYGIYFTDMCGNILGKAQLSKKRHPNTKYIHNSLLKY